MYERVKATIRSNYKHTHIHTQIKHRIHIHTHIHTCCTNSSVYLVTESASCVMGRACVRILPASCTAWICAADTCVCVCVCVCVSVCVLCAYNLYAQGKIHTCSHTHIYTHTYTHTHTYRFGIVHVPSISHKGLPRLGRLHELEILEDETSFFLGDGSVCV